LHGLTPAAATAPIVRRIFTEFLAGNGLFAIAEGLTRDGIACPSASDPSRNRHRSGIAWSKSAVRVILTNPRYTGRQVWNRQRTDEVLLDVDDVAMGHTNVMRWNSPANWIRSDDLAHEPLIDQDTFDQAQELLKLRRAARGVAHERHFTRNTYVFRGAVWCAACQRRMQGQYSHGVAYYRCRFLREYAAANKITHPTNVYVREDALVEPLDGWLATLFAPHQLERTIETLTAGQMIDVPDPAQSRARLVIAECDTKLARYRAALEAGADPLLVTGWIAQVRADRDRAEAELCGGARPSRPGRMSRDEIAALVESLGDIVTALTAADPADKAEVYKQLGLRLTYHPESQTVSAQATLGGSPWGIRPCPRGDTTSYPTVIMLSGPLSIG
jgi:hypothetical protein